MSEEFILTISNIANILLGLTVFIKNPKSATSRLFLLLTISLAAWSTTSYFSVNPILLSQLIWVRLVLLCATLLCLSVYLTFTVFPSQRVKNGQINIYLVGLAIFTMILTITPYVFRQSIGDEPTPNFAMPIFIFTVLALIIGGLRNLYSRIKSSTGREKDQLVFVANSLMITFGVIIMTNLFLVLIIDSSYFVQFGPALTLLFSGSFAYAIVKHKLFDIKAIVARSVAYILLLLSLSILYGISIITITLIFFDSESISVSILVLFAITALIIGYTFQPLKKFFDKASNRLFYQDAYDTQQVLNRLSGLLARTIDLEVITSSSIDIINDAVRASAINLVVVDEGSIYRLKTIGSPINKTGLLAALGDLEGGIVSIDQLDEGHLKSNFKKFDIELVAPLMNQDEVVGYIILGPKKSGSIYTTQDSDLLNISANELGIAVQNARNFEQIQEFNITLQKEIEAATHKLRNTNEKLKALDEAKDEFISMASHQLRTPLTSVKGYVSMVLEGDVGKLNPKQKELLKSAFSSSQRMVYLIADLLNVSRLKTGKFVIEETEVYLPDVVEMEMMQLQETAKSRKLELVYKKPKKFPSVMLDETKIRQVIMNFADNAIYYTPAGGKIKIVLEHDKNSVTYKVVDNGMGVPKEEQHKLFAKFYRAGNAKQARPDGTGLGLFMAKKVVVAQGGAIIFASKSGKGSTFGFTFPMSKVGIKSASKKSKKSATK